MSDADDTKGKNPIYIGHPNDETAQQVEQLAAAGMSPLEVATYLEIAVAVVASMYRNQMEAGSVRAVVTVAQHVYKAATDPTSPHFMDAAKFFLDRSDWKQQDRRKKGIKKA